jgi:16S rRNA (uracil1498-N3)-methyltransferase
MPKFFVSQEQVDKEKIKIVGNDVNHIKNVLREKIGNKLTICNTDNRKDYLCEILKIEEDCIECKIKEELANDVESNVKVTIMQGLPKADKMELIIQKSVELGVYDITPIEMKRCVVKIDEKDKQKKMKRWQKISEVAAKQCGRNIIPNINSIINIKNICNSIKEYDIVLVAYENEKEVTIKQELKKIKEKYNNKEIKIAVIIGPEGGITPDEVTLLQEQRS